MGGRPAQDMPSARPVEERVEGAFPALVSTGTSLPPPLTLPLLWEILSRSPLNRKGCQSRGLHPLTSLDRDDSGRDPSPALGIYLTMAGTRLLQLVRRPHQRPLLGTRTRQVPARRQLQALAPWLAPAGPAAAAGTSLGTASPLKGCFRAVVPAASPVWLPATSGWESAVGR